MDDDFSNRFDDLDFSRGGDRSMTVIGGNRGRTETMT